MNESNGLPKLLENQDIIVGGVRYKAVEGTCHTCDLCTDESGCSRMNIFLTDDGGEYNIPCSPNDSKITNQGHCYQKSEFKSKWSK